GNPVDVKLSTTEATASFKIDQIVSTRTMIVNAQATGAPASGFKIGGISADPPTVVVTGPKQVIDSLGDFLNAEPVDVTGARQDVIKTVNIQRPENVSLADRPGGSVLVRVEIVASQCGGATNDDCPADTIIVPPTFTDIPAGMQIDPGSYSVTVIASGPLPALSSLKRSDITATVSLLGGRAGVATYEVKLSGAPEGVKLEADPISVSLSPVLP
ncbi:MAG: YbbR-like domain-containing protein, partial [Hyphomicrobiales bacterium]